MGAMIQEKIEAIYPLSPMQQGMVFHQLYDSGRGVDMEQLLVRLDEPLAIEPFQQAWEVLVANHELLRAAFRPEQWQQVIFRPGTFSLTWHIEDWRTIPAGAQSAQLEGWLQQDRQQPFNLSQPPLFRLALFRLADQQWQFVWTFHHALLDGRAFAIVISQLFAHYQALATGRPQPIFPPSPSYRHYLDWLTAQELTAAETFWKNYLTPPGYTGILPASSKAIFQNRPSHISPASGKAILENRSTSQETIFPAGHLLAFARAHQLSLATLLQAAHALLLGRYSGAEEVVLGVTRSLRRLVPNGEEMVGLLINTLPLRVPLPAGATILPWLQQLRQQWQAQTPHAHAPLEQIQGWSNLPAGTALFNTIQVYDNHSLNSRLQGPDWLNRHFDLREQPNYPLTIAAYLEGEQLRLKIVYDQSQFSPSAISRLMGHLQRLLHGLATNPAGHLADLSLLTPAEEAQIAVWNDTGRELTTTLKPHQQFEQEAARQPNALALTFGQESLSYAQLNEQANALAAQFQQLTLPTPTLIAITLGRSPQLIAAILAAHKIGATYLPIDPNSPTERLAFMLADSQAALLLGPVAPAGWQPVAPNLFRAPAGPPPADKRLHQAAYLIYTSGSTGRPKGVIVPWPGLLNLIQWHNETFQVTPAARASHLAGLGFDASVWEMWPYLCAGASLHLVEETLIYDPGRLQKWLISQAISHSFIPTPLAEELIERVWPAETALRYLLTGGDTLSKYPPAGLPFTLINNYGPTENSVVTTSGAIAENRFTNSPPTIGQPIANSQLHLLDPNHRQPVPIGVTGELYISGIGLSLGYLNRSFPLHNGRYPTGDLARYRPDGKLEFVGRSDNQVKIRGYRVELGEIETVLAQHPAVQQAIVITHETRPGNKQLLAYIVGATRPDNLRQFLSQQLPNYMIPSQFIFLPTLPLTANGKVDRAALPIPNEGQSQLPLTAMTPLETVLADQISTLLVGRSTVGPDDDFFEMGGNSLLAARFILAVQQQLGREIPVRAVFEQPTIRRLATWLTEQEEGHSLSPIPVGNYRPGTPLPLSPNQQGLWFLEQLHPATPTYNIPLMWKITGPLDVAALSASLNKVVERQAALRAIFPAGDGHPYQLIQPYSPFTLTTVTTTEPESHITPFLTRPFDLERGPLWRALLLRQNDEQFILLIAIHHLVSDGWSVRLLEQELASHYRRRPLSPLSVQYDDVVRWQSEWLHEKSAATQLAFWQEQLQGLSPILPLPTKGVRPAGLTFNGHRHPLIFPAPLTKSLSDLSQQESATLFMTLLAAFHLLLYRYTKESDFVIGIPVANRSRPELQPLIGYFVNTLPLPARLAPHLTFRQLLNQLRQRCLAAFQHQDIALEAIVQAVRPERNLSLHPLFQIIFAFQEPTNLDLPGLHVENVPAGTNTAKFDLSLNLTPDPAGLYGYFEYNHQLFEEDLIAQMGDHFQQLLAAILAAPDQPIGLLPLLSQAEQHQLLVEWNQSQRDYPAGSTFDQLFTLQVARQPTAQALLFEQQQLTYEQLNAWAEQWAAKLTEMGLRPGMVVGLCLERSPAMLVALLAILKCGTAYLPLDPTYPAGRLTFLLADSGAAFLLMDPSASQPNWQAVAPLNEQVALFAPAGPQPISQYPPNLAYILYTSGSTGQPKGVLISQANLVNYLCWAAETFFDDQIALIPTLTRLTFDASLKQLLAPLLAGRPVWMLPDDSLSRPEQLLALIYSQANIGLNCVPAVWQSLCELLASRPQRPDIRRLWLGGEAIPPTLLTKSWQLFPNLDIWNLYGPTEATANAAAGRLHPNTPITIGRPIANTQLYILDDHHQPLPVGLPGELYIGGAGVSSGYLNRPDLTATAFVTVNGLGRLYRTGDIARFRPDGQIEWLRRADEQVKIRGFRVELGEIEATISRQTGVSQALVLAHDGQLWAYVVGSTDEQELKAKVAQELPDYLRPAGYSFLDSFPLTATGKIDRTQLRDHLAHPLPNKRSNGQPTTATEKALAEIWQQTLGLNEVGVKDNFFDLGGHSLKALQLVSRLGLATGRDISIKTLFQYPTVSSLAKQLPHLPLRRRPGPNLQLVQTPLLTLLEQGEVGQLDAAAVGYLGQPDSPYQQALYAAANGQPILNSITETAWGRFAAILLPRFRPELYSDPAGLIADLLTAGRLAGRFGARILALTGLIPSATDYGRAILPHLTPDLPAISTGHATTTTAVILTIERILAESGRKMAQELVGFLGLGSIGLASLRLMLTCLPHPAGLLLCDLYHKREVLEAIAREARESLGYTGPITILESHHQPPPPFYEATFIVGATNVPDILEVDLLRPGTLIVDDSGPHCFNPEAAIGRLEQKQDILFTEGGVLQLPQLVKRTRFVPTYHSSPDDTFQIDEADELMGCAFSSTLSAHFTSLKPTIGLVDLQATIVHYQTLVQLAFRGGSLRCRNYRLSPALIEQFRRHFGE